MALSETLKLHVFHAKAFISDNVIISEEFLERSLEIVIDSLDGLETTDAGP